MLPSNIGYYEGYACRGDILAASALLPRWKTPVALVPVFVYSWLIFERSEKAAVPQLPYWILSFFPTYSRAC
jgi:hypothetical protein